MLDVQSVDVRDKNMALYSFNLTVENRFCLYLSVLREAKKQLIESRISKSCWYWNIKSWKKMTAGMKTPHRFKNKTK